MNTRLAPMHPGEFLREVVLPGTGLPKTRVAKMLHMSRQSLYDILGERSPVTARVAMRLGVRRQGRSGRWIPPVGPIGTS